MDDIDKNYGTRHDLKVDPSYTFEGVKVKSPADYEDYAATLQAQINALPKGGWTAGTYKISSYITLPKGAVIIGDTTPPERQGQP